MWLGKNHAQGGLLKKCQRGKLGMKKQKIHCPLKLFAGIFGRCEIVHNHSGSQ